MSEIIQFTKLENGNVKILLDNKIQYIAANDIQSITVNNSTRKGTINFHTHESINFRDIDSVEIDGENVTGIEDIAEGLAEIFYV